MKKIFLSLLLISFAAPIFSQGFFSVSEEEFGQNRIQMRRLEWKTIVSNNFEFNYNRGGDAIAQKAAKIAEREYGRITETLGYTPFTTMKIFLYKNERQLVESNIGLHAPVGFDGGIINLSRSRVELAYPGNDADFEHELVREISSLFVYDMLYGGSLKEVLQSSILLAVPDWYMKGIANYIAHGEDGDERLAVLKEAIIINGDQKIGNLRDEEAALIGESIWRFIDLNYGPDNISNILNLTRIIRAEKSSITSTLGISFNRFEKEWKKFYLQGLSPKTEKDESVSIDLQANPASSFLKDSKPKLTGLTKGQVDTEHYEFDQKNIDAIAQNTNTRLVESSSTFNQSKLRRGNEKLNVSTPKAYQNLLINNDLNTDIVNDPLRRFGVKLGMRLNDLLENHVFDFNIFLTPSLVNHDIHASYENYEKRIDWGISFDRNAINLSNVDEKNHFLFRPLNISLQQDVNFPIDRKVYLHTVRGKIAYPLSNNLRLQANPAVLVNSDLDLENLNKETLSSTYAGVQLQAIYDNTNQLDPHTLLGSRGKISFERNLSFGNSLNNFDRLNVDLRHYQKLTKGVILAGRFNYGKSMGNSPKYTFLGGMENWFNRSIHPTIGSNPGVPSDLRNIAFYNFAGDLRGFDFAKLYGTNHLLWNMELRISLGSYFPGNAITSSFVRNLKMVLFSDIGTAWNGNKGPFSKQNSLNTDLIGGGGNPFLAEVTNFKNPFLMGYGAGVRTSILGFYLKADYAFGMEDKEMGPGKLYITLGKDF